MMPIKSFATDAFLKKTFLEQLVAIIYSLYYSD